MHDVVLGDVRFANDQLDDMVLLRSDGTPTYMLAVVVDDHDMGVTHVIRGADHLNNAARQLQIIEQMGWPVPVYGHLPLIHGPDGAKLSKRHGALAVEAYRDMGYLPETMRNYLLRLGWSHGDDEIISTEQAIEWFNLESIGKSPARMDFKKLDNLNGHYIRETQRRRAGGRSRRPFWRARRRRASVDMTARATARCRPCRRLKERPRPWSNLLRVRNFCSRTVRATLDAAAEKLLTAGGPRRPGQASCPALEATDWTGPALEAGGPRLSPTAEGLKLGQVAQPLRAALTGKATSPPLFEMMALLGREESLVRLRAYAA